MKKFMLSLLMFSMLFLTSCFIPDNYEADVFVRSDGSYEFTYHGELNYAPALEAVIKGEFDDEFREDFQEIIEDMKGEPGFKTVTDLGKGKIRVAVNIAMVKGKDYHFISKDLKIFSFDYLDNGNLSITGLTLDDDGKKAIKELKTKMEGNLTVTVEKGVKVQSHNADKKKKIDKKLTAYTWKIDIDSKVPAMIVEP